MTKNYTLTIKADACHNNTCSEYKITKDFVSHTSMLEYCKGISVDGFDLALNSGRTIAGTFIPAKRIVSVGYECNG